MSLPARTQYTAALDTRCTAALTLCQRTSTTLLTDSAYPLHHSPHTSDDQAAYTAWPSNHAAQQDMHSA
eukprot:CAMPEP_0179406428 /NCGR_PEP_ID=MMETSP0799-20121207/887_1 /TAXON_ID=46947 /ORGANISM="Geminigera cryophila, Strain CCMP2564" /LENGTH=68 /DNA_ID=CAMNT_0021177487 /DNA_START=571 /DNA_END=775 /DNA_ORIENTATION=+